MAAEGGELTLVKRIFAQRKRLSNVADAIGLARTGSGLTGGFLEWVEKEICLVNVGLSELEEELENGKSC